MAETSDPRKTIDTQELKREFAALKAERANIEARWDDIERYFDPLGSGGRAYVTMNEQAVELNRSREPWDSTAIDASEKLAASIHGSITSPAVRWFKLKWRNQDLANDRESSTWLDQASEAAFQTLMDSDFNTEIASADSDLVRYANCFLVAEAADEFEWRGMDFRAVMVRDGYFREESRGGLDRFYERLYWTPVQVVDLCQRKGWAVPSDITEKAKLADQNANRIEYAFCVFKRPEAQKKLEHAHDRNRQRQKGRKAIQDYSRRMPREGDVPPAEVDADEMTYPLAVHLRPVGGVYFRADTGEALGDECGYYDFPVFFTRWAKTAGSKWGHGPCFTLLATVKTLNAIVEAEYEALARMVNPPVTVEERGLIGDLNLEPGGVNVVRKVDQLKPFDNHARLDASGARSEQLRQAIQHGLFSNEIALKDSPAMTLGEVQIRYELMNRTMGGTLARIEADELGPVVRCTLGYLARAKQLPPLPPKVQEAYGDRPPDFDVEYLGPLARSQRTDEVASIERALAFDQSLLRDQIPRFTAAVTATVNIAKAIRKHHQLLGVPADLLNSEKEVDAKLAAMDQAEAAAAKAAQAQAEGEAKLAHAQAANQMMQAQAPGAPGPVPAQPPPPVAPVFGA